MRFILAGSACPMNNFSKTNRSEIQHEYIAIDGIVFNRVSNNLVKS